MFRKWVLGSVGMFAAAVFVLSTADNAWARRCCRNGYYNGGYSNGVAYNNGSWGSWRRGNANNCCGGNGVATWSGTYTSPGGQMTTTGSTQGYSTGYPPQSVDANGNPINYVAPINPQAPAPAPESQAPAPPVPVRN